MVTEPKEFFDLLYSSEFEVSDARIVNDETVEVHYRNVDEFAEQNNKVNIVVAAFTTAYARLKLYDLLDLLQERVFYYDTDSVIYLHEPGKPEPPLGNYLGDLTDELDGDYITTFISGGPKNYAYVTNKGKAETKIRGITLDYATTGKLNPCVMRKSRSFTRQLSHGSKSSGGHTVQNYTRQKRKEYCNEENEEGLPDRVQ